MRRASSLAALGEDVRSVLGLSTLLISALTATPALAGSPPAAKATTALTLLHGRVFTRGSITVIPGAEVTTSTDEVVIADAEGRFDLRLPPGEVRIAIRARDHEPLHITEQIAPGREITVEYRLEPAPHTRGRFQTTVRGDARHQGERFTLRDEELHQMPGTLGDPFRVIGLLPGVSQPVALLPLYVVRGDSPGTSGFLLDGMRVPALFHLLVGGGVVNPRLVDRIDFFPGAYDASFGRYAGGIIDAETRPARADGPHAEVELRPLEVSGLGELHWKDLRVAVAGNYGNPTPIVNVFSPGANLQFWDYQVRVDWRGLTLEALGSYDYLNLGDALNGGVKPDPTDNSVPTNDFRIAFYRVQLRDRFRKEGFELEAAIVGGIDQMSILGGEGVEKLAVSARINARYRRGWLTLFAGADAEVSRFEAHSFSTTDANSAPDELGDLGGARDGIVGSAFAQATGDLFDHHLAITAGARIDVYHTLQSATGAPITLLGVDPRLTLRWKLMDGLAVNAGIGLYQQPPSFPVPLPGIDTYALQLGLQRSIQGAAGIEADLPAGFSFKATGFYQQLYNTNDFNVDILSLAATANGAVGAPPVCTSPPPESLTGLPAKITRQVDGQSYGMELLARRSAGRVTGWLAYTLSRSERIYSCGLRPSDFDQAHVLNFVLQVRLPWNLLAGMHLAYSSGRPFTHVTADSSLANAPLRNNDRMPGYLQLDLRVDREWIFDRWALSVFVEALNVTYSQTIYGVQYAAAPNQIPDYLHPEFQGFKWVLPWFGVRGRL